MQFAGHRLADRNQKQVIDGHIGPVGCVEHTLQWDVQGRDDPMRPGRPVQRSARRETRQARPRPLRRLSWRCHLWRVHRRRRQPVRIRGIGEGGQHRQPVQPISQDVVSDEHH